jgi:hypothetical protein
MIFKKIGNMEDVEVICHYLKLLVKTCGYPFPRTPNIVFWIAIRNQYDENVLHNLRRLSGIGEKDVTPSTVLLSLKSYVYCVTDPIDTDFPCVDQNVTGTYLRRYYYENICGS